ncbi:hypothetical protein [Proteus sp. G2300]|uniref:hypothetical protein n=1 Tax=Proteus sp. G2300 TaxID=2698839 RepID=UPI001378B9EC|nr:hypothetical protein [Proteus sp. G2300]NBN86779.1 hypothetical protein [Proteus sp. G2300]
MRILFLIIIIALSGCVTGDKISSIHSGMSKDNVISIMGNPDGNASSNDYEILIYANRLMSGWSYDKADYKFIFKNNSLIEYGPEKIRQDNGASAIRAISAQQSLLLWQQQKNIYKKPVTTTNCTKLGSTVNCTSY